jgi:copper oxidase (laccase) domain-containing protein
MVEQRLRACGVREISHSRICTVTDSQAWFSHRREGHCGRMASLIWLA